MPDSSRTDRKGPVYPVTAINILKARGKSARESRQAGTHSCPLSDAATICVDSLQQLAVEPGVHASFRP